MKSRPLGIYTLCWIGVLICVQIHMVVKSDPGAGCFSNGCHELARMLSATVLGVHVHWWATGFFLATAVAVAFVCIESIPRSILIVRVLVVVGAVCALLSIAAQIFVVKRMCPYCASVDGLLFLLTGLGLRIRQPECTKDQVPAIGWATLFAALCIFLIVNSPILSRSDDRRTLATVNGEPITENDLRAEIGVAVQPLEEMKYAAVSSWLEEKIDRVLLRQAAAKNGAVTNRENVAEKSGNHESATVLRKTAKVEINLRPPKPLMVNLDLQEAILVGNENARVKIILFTDFECPFCKMTGANVKRLQQAHPQNVLVAYWQFPLKAHKNARLAAQAAHCADAQGKFPAFHEALERADDVSQQSIAAAAESAGLKMDSFNSCLAGPEMAKKVDDEVLSGERIGVDSIPTIFLNGKLVGGSLSFEELESLYTAEVAPH